MSIENSLLVEAVRRATSSCFGKDDDGDDIELEFGDDELAMLERASQETNHKIRTVLILNALQENSSDIDYFFEHVKNDDDYMNYDLFFSKEELEEMRDADNYELYDPHLAQFCTADIAHVEMDGLMPRSITFNKLSVPILSYAFGCIVTEVRFGTPSDYLYQPDDYKGVQEFLASAGYVIPDNIYQMHHFMIYMQRSVLPAYFSGFMSYIGCEPKGIFKLINIYQALNGHPAYIYGGSSDAGLRWKGESIDGLDSQADELINDIVRNGFSDPVGVCEGDVVVSEGTGGWLTTNCLLFNKGGRRYMGVVHNEDNVLYRSVPDLFYAEMSKKIIGDRVHYSLIRIALKTYVIDNKVSIVDDGLRIKILEKKHWPSAVLVNDGFDFSNEIEVGNVFAENISGVYRSELEFSIGWSVDNWNVRGAPH